MEWIKRNKLASLIIAVLLFMVLKNSFGGIYLNSARNLNYGGGGDFGEMAMTAPSLSKSVSLPAVGGYAPVQTTDRLVVQESSLSLVVKDVRDGVDKIEQKAKETGGFMISSSLSKPEDAPYGNISVRIPADKLKEVLDYYRKLAIKVSSENLYGYDVTDQYVDIQARLDTLAKTKAKFEEILKSAIRVQDLLEVNRELINLQVQIDNLKGQQKYLEQTAKLAKVTVYLSTDELALPYAPSKSFRPSVIFKQAVRSLIGAFRSIATALIWIIVFVPVWVPALLIYRFLKKRLKK